MHISNKSEADHLGKASSYIQAVFQRYRKAILLFGNDIAVNPTDVKYIGFVANGRRMANFHIGKQSFKIWLNIRPGTIADPRRLTRQTRAGHTIRIEDDRNFDYIIGLLKQAYTRNR